ALPSGNNAVFTTNPGHTAGTLTWTPTFNDGRPTPYTVSFTATNAQSGFASTAVTVTNVDRPPIVSAPASITKAEGLPFTLDVSASDPDGQAITSLTADLSGLPAGHNAAFTSNASHNGGTLSWQPGFGDAGTYTVSFRAANTAVGATTTTVTIANADRAPQVSAPDQVEVSEIGTLS